MVDIAAWIAVRAICGAVGFFGTFLLMGRTWRFFADDSGPSRVLTIAAVVGVLFMVAGPQLLNAIFDRTNGN